MQGACFQVRSIVPNGQVPPTENAGQVRERALEPWRKFPSSQAHLLAGDTDPSLARKRRRGERPVTLAVLIEWMFVCRRTGLPSVGRKALQPLADIIGHDVVPRVRRENLRTPAEEVADVSRASGEALGAFADAMADGVLDAADAAALIKTLTRTRDEIDEAIAALRDN